MGKYLYNYYKTEMILVVAFKFPIDFQRQSIWLSVNSVRCVWTLIERDHLLDNYWPNQTNNNNKKENGLTGVEWVKLYYLINHGIKQNWPTYSSLVWWKMVRDGIQLMNFYFRTQMYETGQYCRLSELWVWVVKWEVSDDPSIEIMCHVILL